LLRRLMIGALALMVVGGGGFLLYQHFSSPRYATAIVRRGDIEAFVEATGRVRPLRELSLSSQVNGRVKSVAVKRGDSVRKGQLLLELEAPELEWQLREATLTLDMRRLELEKALSGPSPEELKAAEAQLAAAKAKLAALKERPSEEEIVEAKTAMEKAEAALKLAQAEYDKVAWMGNAAMLPQAFTLQQATLDYEAAKARYQALLKGPSPAELEAARKEVEAAEAQLEKLRQGPSEQEVKILRKRVELAEEAVAKAREALRQTKLLAPWDGVVTGVYVEEGEVVPAYRRLLSLADTSKWEIEAEIDELDVGKVSPGQQVLISFDAFPTVELKGLLEEIEPAPVAERGSIIYKAHISFDPDTLPMRINLSVNLRIIVGHREGVLLVPRAAIRQMGTKEAVKILREGKVEMVEVTTGLSDGENVEIIRGLEEGQIIVLD